MGKINVYEYDDSMIENQKKKKIWIKKISHRAPSKRSFTSGIHSLLRRADARENADMIYLSLTHIASLRFRHSY